MKLSQIPFLKQVRDAGADDRVFDGLLVVGPLIIVLISIVGRNLLTSGLALAYLVTFVGYILYRGLV